MSTPPLHTSLSGEALLQRQKVRREQLAQWKATRLPLLKQQLAKRPTSLATADPTTSKRPRPTPLDANDPDAVAQALAAARAAAASVVTAHQQLADADAGGDAMDVDAQPPGQTATPDANTESQANGTEGNDNDMDGDALDQFMLDVQSQVREINQADAARLAAAAASAGDPSDPNSTALPADKLTGNNDNDSDVDPDDILAYAAKKLAKKKDMATVDHSQIEYEPFTKIFYIEPPELAHLTPDDVAALRLSLDGIKVQGKNPPKPATKWSQLGLPGVTMDTIKRLGFTSPTPIQAQAVPAIMAGRDVIGVAKTGSGKTVAFLLPLLRHVKAQRPLAAGEGPVALIMTPTRELAMQIHKEMKTFGKPLGLRSLCCYGGSPISDQIAELKRGAEVVVCTPGRMIDLLTANSGRVTNLRRVTYLVLDEADRMFDMGFEPQVMKIVNNVRPNRQTVLFSATFPRQMEALARKILRRPLEITVGGKSVVTSTVTQMVEVISDGDKGKYLKLLDLLGRWYSGQGGAGAGEDGSRILIFVDRQESADDLLNLLFKRGYVCNSLHGGKDQADRDSTISDFKAGVFPILIATSVAARGLDVKGLNLVVNYDCPNHKEDYVHRVGRTGRAGKPGTAVTFITPDQERYAGDLVDAMRASGAQVPEALDKLATGFKAKVQAGQAQRASSGFGGKGLEKLDKDREVMQRAQKLAMGIVDEVEEDEAGDDEDGADDGADGSVPERVGDIVLPPTVSVRPEATGASIAPAAATATAASTSTGPVSSAVLKAQEVAARINAQVKLKSAAVAAAASSAAAAAASVAGAAPAGTGTGSEAGIVNYTCEFEINDYPQRARWRVTNKEQINQIVELSGAAMTTRGLFFPPGKTPGPGERKLYLFIEGETQLAVDKAKMEIARILREATLASVEIELKASNLGGGGGAGRYSVV
ncbi:P-loop containing nucleoside triphosphate hydrolase protein [Catenaria anguillulae PL171]|uniref:RNA helicase n=1 Tax=Catenaria anguillulae PL171 TaxID=765915 RepID=A0A1Y2HSC0_9FUNG|nr:P-loop containing nucleoside triphosphate hydrolase protein [Catenaria anguillulae PL171]